MTEHCGVLQSRFLDGVKKAVRWAVAAVIDKAGEVGLNLEGCEGGYFCLQEEDYDDLAIEPMLVEEVPNGKDNEYIAFCQEKVKRLLTMHYQDGHLLSWESRNEDKKQYGGAITTKPFYLPAFYFGFSGLPEMLDEAAMLLTAVRAGCMSMEKAKELAELSRNTFFLENDWGYQEE